MLLRAYMCAVPDELDCQSQVCDAAGAVPLHQDVLALEVAVGDGGFALGAVDLRVEVAEAAGGGVGQSEQGLCVQGRLLQEVVQGAVLVIMGDEPQLGAGVSRGHVRRHEAWHKNRRT